MEKRKSIRKNVIAVVKAQPPCFVTPILQYMHCKNDGQFVKKFLNDVVVDLNIKCY